MVATYLILHRCQRASARAARSSFRYATAMLRYPVAYYLPRGENRMVVAEVLDFPGVFSQGFDLSDARSMVASTLLDVAQVHVGQGMLGGHGQNLGQGRFDRC